MEAEPSLAGLRQELFDARGNGMAQPAEGIQGQSQAGLAIGAGAAVDGAEAVELEEGAGVADDFAAGAAGVQDLVEETPEGAAA